MNSPAIISRLLLRTRPVELRRGASTIEDFRPELILSETNRKSCVAKLKLYRTSRKLEDGEVNQAAVLVPLCTHKGELGLLYTLRSTKLNSNRGQVSFPGGMRDKGDKTLEETALRETWEELKVPREKVDVWTCGHPIGRKNINVVPVLGYVGEIEPDKMDTNPHEVEEAFVVSLKCLSEPSLCRFTQFRDSYTLPTYLGGKHRIWGLTAAITHMVLTALVPGAYRHKLVYLQPIEEIYKQRQANNPTS